jgi:hypothetical protein
MQVMIEVTNPLAREQTMTKTEDRSKTFAPDGVRCHLENIANQLAVLLASLDPDPKSAQG